MRKTRGYVGKCEKNVLRRICSCHQEEEVFAVKGTLTNFVFAIVKKNVFQMKRNERTN
jgi:hypothetical protein